MSAAHLSFRLCIDLLIYLLTVNGISKKKNAVQWIAENNTAKGFKRFSVNLWFAVFIVLDVFIVVSVVLYCCVSIWQLAEVKQQNITAHFAW